MIIGHGDIANALKDKNDLLFFASGVSNSQEKRETEYQREIDLLLKQDKKKHVVYFGSLCIFYSNSRYAKHKKQMEKLVKDNFKHYTIVRAGNITWGTNPYTLINSFKHQIKEGKKIEVWDTYRYIVDKSEFLHWISLIPKWNCEINITGKMLKTKEILKMIKLRQL
jgi:nucleoside-diphosphate-sugar epimerase